jgi:hypothetical protein
MAKSKSRQAAESPRRVKVSVYLSPAAVQKLGAACASENKKRSDMFEAMINKCLVSR